MRKKLCETAYLDIYTVERAPHAWLSMRQCHVWPLHKCIGDATIKLSTGMRCNSRAVREGVQNKRLSSVAQIVKLDRVESGG